MSRCLSIAALAFLSVFTSARADIVAGRDYVVVSTPQRQDINGKIEVLEFFSWGCPHCSKFYPMLSRWVANLPKDVAFRRVPVSLGHPEWEALAKTYYALQATGDVERLDPQIFEAIHEDHLALFDEGSITAWVGKHGVDAAKFTAAFHSFAVNMNADQSDQKAISYQIPGVPTLAIAAKYTVGGEHAKMLSTSDELIAMVRAANKK